MARMDELLDRTIGFFAGMPKQVQHLLKVRGFAVMIARDEGLDAGSLEIIEAAAIVHDAGIKPALAKYGSAPGRCQEELGPEEARALMSGWPEETIRRVCWLVAHHHSYRDIQDTDHQILVEADFLVNLYEHDCGGEEIQSTLEKIFRMEKGKQLCRVMFGL